VTPRYASTPAGAVASYEPAHYGPFRCDHCEYQTELYCEKPEVVKEAKMLRGLADSASIVKIESGGCCNFFSKR
jgi:hypothetical protein